MRKKPQKIKDSNKTAFHLNVKITAGFFFFRSDQLILGNQLEAVEGKAVFGKRLPPGLWKSYSILPDFLTDGALGTRQSKFDSGKRFTEWQLYWKLLINTVRQSRCSFQCSSSQDLCPPRWNEQWSPVSGGCASCLGIAGLPSPTPGSSAATWYRPAFWFLFFFSLGLCREANLFPG